MLRSNGTFLAAALLLSIVVPASGATYKIRSIGRAPDGSSAITVNFITSSAPPLAEAQDKASWKVTIMPQSVAATVQSITIGDYTIARRLTLMVCFPDGTGGCSPNFPDHTDSYLVIFASKSGTAQLTEPFNRAPVSAASTMPTQSTVHLSGGLSAAEGAAPTYTIDSAVDLHPGGTGFGVTGAVKTDNRKKVDPDSFTFGLNWLHMLSTPAVPAGHGQIIFQGVLLRINYAGVEFARTGKDLNFVTAPYLALPFAVNSLDAKGSPVNTWNFELRAGIEGGNNFKNSLNQNGYGGFLRTDFGASNIFIFRKVAGFDHIEIDSSYDVRLPDKKELFGTANSAGTIVYTLSSKPRHYVTNTVTGALNANWGISVQHKYGSLPPTFNFVENTVSVGLSYTYPAK